MKLRQKWSRVRTSKAAKSAHAATTGKAEHTFAGTEIYRCKILNDLRSPRKDRMSDENLEGTEDGHSNVGSPLRVDGPDLPASVCA
jgi:hypothetical protein